MNKKIAKALVWASKGHANQTRKYDGAPYIHHLLEVKSLLASIDATDDTIIAGVLHDALEDTSITEQQVRSIFGDNVLDMIALLTEDKTLSLNKRHQMTIFKMLTASAKVINIKLADMLSNMCAIPPTWDDEERAAYLDRCKDVLDAISSNSAPSAVELKALANFIHEVETKGSGLYPFLCRWATQEQLYWSTGKACFLYLSKPSNAMHMSTKLESPFERLFELGLMHGFEVTDEVPIQIKETSFLEGDMDVVQNKHAFVHNSCVRVALT